MNLTDGQLAMARGELERYGPGVGLSAEDVAALFDEVQAGRTRRAHALGPVSGGVESLRAALDAHDGLRGLVEVEPDELEQVLDCYEEDLAELREKVAGALGLPAGASVDQVIGTIETWGAVLRRSGIGRGNDGVVRLLDENGTLPSSDRGPAERGPRGHVTGEAYDRLAERLDRTASALREVAAERDAAQALIYRMRALLALDGAGS